MIPREVVLAGSYAQFDNYVHNTGRPRREFIFADRIERVIGLESYVVRKVGTWRDLPAALVAEVERRARR